MNADKDYYAVLGVLPSVDEAALSAVYRALLKKYHPDVFQGARKDAEARTREIIEAYNTIGNPDKRRFYDSARASRGVGPKAHQGSKGANGSSPGKAAADARATPNNLQPVARKQHWPAIAAAIFGLLMAAALFYGLGKNAPSPASPVAPQGVGTIAGTQVQYEYEHAVQFLLQNNYDEAEQAFRTFADQHPADPLARRAQDWLGMTYLLRLGASLEEQGRSSDACSVFDKVSGQYLSAHDADTQKVLAVVDSEKQRFACF